VDLNQVQNRLGRDLGRELFFSRGDTVRIEFFRNREAAWALLACLSFARPVSAATLAVGPGKTYAEPCAAIAAATDGDTIEIDAIGNYDGDVCAIAKNGLTLRGIGGRARIDAAQKNYGGRAIWVIIRITSR
jgi:hypothetical protein